MSLRDKYLAPHSEATGVAPQSPTMDAFFGMPAALAQDVYGVHQMLETMLGPRSKRGYLWHLAADPGGPVCIVRSASLPPAMLQKARPTRVPNSSETALFQVTANPQAKSKSDNRRRPLTRANTAGRLKWFERRAALAGFKASGVRVETHQRWITRNGRRFWLDASTFDGELTVTDGDQFAKAMIGGFGYGRAWGFGLIQLFDR